MERAGDDCNKYVFGRVVGLLGILPLGQREKTRPERQSVTRVQTLALAVAFAQVSRRKWTEHT